MDREGAMKLLLTSGGVSNQSIRDALADLLGKPVAESSALCIPTAMYGMPGTAVMTWRQIAGQTPTPMVELGWKSVGMLELTALPSIDEENWVPMVRETDALLVCGGGVLYLHHLMRESGRCARKTPWLTPRSGPRTCRRRGTRSTTTRPSRWWTAPSRSSPRGTGSSSTASRRQTHSNK